jgi:predicted transcriptional regulator
MTTSGGRAKFVESMEGIMKGVKQVQLRSLFGNPSDIVEIGSGIVLYITGFSLK